MKNKHTVLIIDDDPNILEDLKDTIKSLGHKAITKQNQKEANDYLKKVKPCLILLDLAIKTDRNSPKAKIDIGFNLLTQIRSRFSREKLPIIIITAHKGENDELGIRGLQNDANDMVKKPFTGGILEESIKKWLDKCQIHSQFNEKFTPQFTTSDDDNLTNDTFVFDGRSNSKRRNLIIINGKKAWVRTKSFEVLWNLAVPLWKEESGWLKAFQIANGNNPHQAILRAREDIKKCVKNPCKTIENNGNQYRLSTLPNNCKYNEKNLKKYFSHLLTKLK